MASEDDRSGSAQQPEAALVSAVVRVRGRDGEIGGAGVLVTEDLVLTCAHVVSDALGLSRDAPVGVGTEVSVDLPLADVDRPLADGVGGTSEEAAEVQHWVPVRPDQTGDVAVLRLNAPLPGGSPLPMADAESVWDHRARAVGFTDDQPDGIWHRGMFRGATGRGWVQLSRADGQTAHVKRGFSGGPVWDDELGAAVGLMVVAQTTRETRQAFVLRTRALVREVPELAPLLGPSTPFLGLATFQEADSGVFFGRDEDVAQAVSALRGERPSVVLYGPSGCGKSSLALAGVVPRMREAGCEVLVVDAGRVGSARAALATELFELVRSDRHGPARAESVDQVDRWLADLGLADTFHRATGRPATELLVVLDQAEALLDRPESELTEVVELLFPQPRLEGPRALVTLRADFVSAALSHPRLGPALKGGETLPLTPMSREQLHAVITEPLRHIPAIDYDPGLDRRILDDAGGEPGVLPLLGFVLAQLWDERAAGRLRNATYEKIGGVSGALRQHAEETWRECVPAESEEEARRLLTGLVRVLPGDRAPLRRALTREEAGEERWRLAKALANRRLLVMHGGEGQLETAELAHEALITEWPTLAELSRADTRFLEARAEVQHDLERWQKADGSLDLLPGTLQLVGLEARLRGRDGELTEEQRDFLARARKRQRALRARFRAMWAAVAVVLALLVGLGTFLVQESQVSREREAEGRSRAIATQSDELTDSNPGQAALAALAAYETSPTQEARSALLRRYQELQDAKWTLSGAEGDGEAAAMSTDGAVTLVTTQTGRATLFVRSDDGTVRQEQLRLPANVLSPVVSRDGRRIAYVRDGERTLVWHQVTPSKKRMVGKARPLRGKLNERSFAASSGTLKTMDFSPDGSQLVVVSAAVSKQPARIWDLKTGRPRELPEDIAHFTDVWFGSDGNTLVAAHSPEPLGKKNAIVVIDIAAGTMREMSSGANLDPAGMSGDGSTAVTCRTEEPKPGSDALGKTHYRAIRVADGKTLGRYRDDEQALCKKVAVSEMGERFAVQAETGEWDLVDTSGQGGDARRFSGPSDAPHPSDNAYLPLLGTSRNPVLVTRESSRVTAWKLSKVIREVHGFPQLTDDGEMMVARTGENGDRLSAMRTEGDKRVVAEAPRDATTPVDKAQLPELNRAETLVADVSNGNRITIRALPSLREVSEFTTAKPPTDDQGKPEQLRYMFLDGDRLMTHSGATVEYWDAREGRRLAPPLELDELRLTTKDQPQYMVGRHPESGHGTVSVRGEPDAHAVDLRTGRENKDVRVRLNEDLNSVVYLRDPRYAAVMTTGGMVELWSVRRGRTAEKVVGPLGPVKPDQWMAGHVGKSGFFVANKSSVRFLKADDPGYRESYEFAEDQRFVAAADEGGTLIHSGASGGSLSLTHLDPAVWKRHLCAVLGRDLTEDERGGLPDGIPTDVCPS